MLCQDDSWLLVSVQILLQRWQLLSILGILNEGFHSTVWNWIKSWSFLSDISCVKWAGCSHGLTLSRMGATCVILLTLIRLLLKMLLIVVSIWMSRWWSIFGMTLSECLQNSAATSSLKWGSNFTHCHRFSLWLAVTRQNGIFWNTSSDRTIRFLSEKMISSSLFNNGFENTDITVP